MSKEGRHYVGVSWETPRYFVILRKDGRRENNLLSILGSEQMVCPTGDFYSSRREKK